MSKKKEITKVLEWHNSGKLKTDEAVERIYSLFSVVGQGEQLTCPSCKSTNILSPDKDNDARCIKCGFIWAG